MRKFKAEYIWIDGQKPTAKLRSKTKIIDGDFKGLESLPEWTFDGSSTYQAEGKSSDLALKPVRAVINPLRGDGRDYLVLCEVFNSDGKTPHPINTRAPLRAVAEKTKAPDPWFGRDQEYTLTKRNHPPHCFARHHQRPPRGKRASDVG